MALKIRDLVVRDLVALKEIHERDYPNLHFPDFRSLAGSFIIENEQNEIIMAGGVEIIGEALLVTDKSKSRTQIGKSLVLAQRVSEYISRNVGIRELHAFVDEDDYAKHLIKHGFVSRQERHILFMRTDGQEKDSTT